MTRMNATVGVSTGEATIKRQFVDDDSRRHSILQRARRCAELSKPHYLPPENQDATDELPENYQSLVARGVSNMEGRLLTALFPPGTPWFELAPTAKTLGELDPDQAMQVRGELFRLELLILAAIEEGSGKQRRRAAGRSSFYTAKRTALGLCLVTGDVLEHLDDDYRLRVFRRDQYVTRRDSAGDVLYHIVREKIDPLTLTDEQLDTAGLDPSDLADKHIAERMVDIYTRCQWQPRDRTWLIEQEVNGEIVNESVEPVTPYLSTPFELAPGEDYGRGFCEQNYGNIRSYDELSLRTLQFAEINSKIHPTMDYASEVLESDLAKPSGTPLRARVEGGQIQDVGFLRVDKLGDFRVVGEVRESLRAELSQSMLLGSEVVRDSERTTAFEVQTISLQELQGALGGMYAAIAERQQVPLLDRVMFQMTRDKLIPRLPEEAVTPRVLTGIAALQRQEEWRKVAVVVDAIRNIDPELRTLDARTLGRMAERLIGLREPITKSDEQIERERQDALREQAAMQAAEQTIETAGAVAQQRATQGATA